MTKITLRRIFSKHVLLKRTQFQLTQAQLAEAVGTSHGWIQKIESGKKMPGFFLAIKLAVFLEIDMNMAEIGDVRRFHSKTASVAFAGIDASPYQSGQIDIYIRNSASLQNFSC